MVSTRGCHDEFCGAWIKGYLLFCCPSGSSCSAGGVGSLVSSPQAPRSLLARPFWLTLVGAVLAQNLAAHSQFLEHHPLRKELTNR